MKKTFCRIKLFAALICCVLITGCSSLPVMMPDHYQQNADYKNLSLACEIGEIQWAEAPNPAIRQTARKYMEAKLIEDKRFKTEILHNRDFDNMIKDLQEVGEKINTATLKDNPVHLALSITPVITTIIGADRGKSVVLYKVALHGVFYSTLGDKIEKEGFTNIIGYSKDVYRVTRGNRMIGQRSHADVAKAVQAALDDALSKVSLLLLRKVPIVANVSKVMFDGDNCLIRLDSGSRMGIRNNWTPMILIEKDGMGIPLAFGLPVSVESEKATIQLRQWNNDSSYASSVRARLRNDPDSMKGKLIMVSNIDQPTE